MAGMRVLAVGVDARRQPVMLLQEMTGQARVLPIWIGAPEAGALAQARLAITSPRPDTHELFAAILARFGRRLEQVVITTLEQATFHAELVFDNGARVAARPSDAVILAVRLDTPIEAADVVLDRAALPLAQFSDVTNDAAAAVADPSDVSEAGRQAIELDQLRRFLDTATADDFDTDT